MESPDDLLLTSRNIDVKIGGSNSISRIAHKWNTKPPYKV